MTSQVDRLPTVEEYDRYDNHLILTQFLIGIPMLLLFIFWALPILHNMEYNTAFFLGSAMVLAILFIPIKLSFFMVKPEWENNK